MAHQRVDLFSFSHNPWISLMGEGQDNPTPTLGQGGGSGKRSSLVASIGPRGLCLSGPFR